MSVSQNFPAISPSLLLDFANVQALDPRITFARATTGTYYGTRTALAEQNLFTFSQEFDNALWQTASLITVTANSTAAPDGNTTADTAAANSNGTQNAVFRNEITPPIGSTISVYAKANSVNFLAVAVGAGSNVWASFNLSTGVLGSNGAGCTPSIVSVGNGWYRCIVANIGTASNQILLFPKTADVASNPWSTGSVSIGDSIFLWGAQLEQRSTVTAYTPTTTQPITNYIPVLETAASGVARFDHNPVTFESLGLLVEQQSTNLLTYSEDFSNAAWTKANCTIGSNTIIAPDGTLTGDKLISASGLTYGVDQTITATAQAYTFTVFAKKGGYNFIQLLWSGSASSNFANFDLNTGTITAGTYTSATITSVGNGWYRCSITSTLAAGVTGSFVWLPSNGTSARGGTVSGNGFDGVYLWGAQVEASAFSTSYIPTVASQVTRAADAASITGTNFSSWYQGIEGTFYFESQKSPQTLNGRYFEVTNSNGQSYITWVQANSTTAQASIYVNNSSQAVLNFTNTSLTLFKGAVAYKTNDVAACVNGETVLVDALALIPDPSVLSLYIGKYLLSDTQYMLNGTIKKIAYYPLRLSNTNLQALTG
jgi:hypothetical protein